MTKYEAFEAIASVDDDISWIEYRDRILAILDQIDQPPGEFSVRELVELIGNVERIQHVAIANEGDCTIRFNDGRFTCVHLDDLKTELMSRSKLPEPKTIMVELPLAVAKCCAEYRDGDIAKACKAALEKAKL